MAVTPAQSAPPGTPHDSDPRNLHDLAVDITTDLHKLATGLTAAGAQPQIVQRLTQMADLVSQAAKVLANGPVGAAPHPPQGAPPPGQPPQGAPPPGAPPPGAPASQAAPPVPPHQQAANTIHAATEHLANAAHQAYQQRQQPPR